LLIGLPKTYTDCTKQMIEENRVVKFVTGTVILVREKKEGKRTYLYVVLAAPFLELVAKEVVPYLSLSISLA